jgi:hypothetical protein
MRKILLFILCMAQGCAAVMAQNYTQGAKTGNPFIRNGVGDKYAVTYQALINGGLHSGTIAGRDSLLSYYQPLLRPYMEYNTPNQKWLLNASATAWIDVTRYTKAQVDSIAALKQNSIGYTPAYTGVFASPSTNTINDFNLPVGGGIFSVDYGGVTVPGMPVNSQNWQVFRSGNNQRGMQLFSPYDQDRYFLSRAASTTPGVPAWQSPVELWHSGNLPTPESTSNKVTSLTTPNNTTYPTTQAVANAIASATPVLQSLTFGYGLSGLSYNGSTARTAAVDTNVVATKNNTLTLAQAQTKFNAENLAAVAGRSALYAGRLSTQGNDGTVYNNYLNQTTLPTPVSGQANFGFIGGSPAWRNLLGQRRLRTSYAGDIDYYLPTTPITAGLVRLANKDSVDVQLATKLNPADSVIASNRYVNRFGRNETVDGVKTFLKNLIVNNGSPGIRLTNTNTGYSTQIYDVTTNDSTVFKGAGLAQGTVQFSANLSNPSGNATQYFRASDSGIPTTGDRSWGFIINSTANVGNQTIWAEGIESTSSSTNKIIIRANYISNNFQIAVIGNGSNIISTNLPAKFGQFHQCWVTYTSATNTTNLYIDGVAVGTSTAFTPAPIYGGNIFIGAQNLGGAVTAGVSGLLQMAYRYTVVISPTTIAALWASGSSAYPTTGLLRGYTLNNTLADAAGSGFSLTALGSPPFSSNGLVTGVGGYRLNRTYFYKKGGNRLGGDFTPVLGAANMTPEVEGINFVVRLPALSITPIFVNRNGGVFISKYKDGVLAANGGNLATSQLQLDASDGTAETAPLKLTPGTNLTTPEAGAEEFDGTLRYYTTSAGTRLTYATTNQITASRTSALVASSFTMVLNADYLNTSATQYTLTLPATTGFTADGSKIITVLATGTGGVIIRVPSGYSMQSGSTFATTTGTGGATLTQGTKVQLIPIGTNGYYLQPLNGSVTLY